MIKSFSAPIVNLNGSSPERLIEDLVKAMDAVRGAIKAVAEAAPHPRDWQTAADGDALFRWALADHQRRLRELNGIAEELEGIALSVQDQQQERRKC